MARMQQRKAWSRRDEIEEEAAQVEAAEAEAARLEQQQLAALELLSQKLDALEVLPVSKSSPPAPEEPGNCVRFGAAASGARATVDEEEPDFALEEVARSDRPALDGILG